MREVLASRSIEEKHSSARRLVRTTALYLSFLFGGGIPAQQPSPTFTTFDAPGAGTARGQGTVATSINTVGAIAGQYVDTGSQQHGFVRAPGGAITSFDPPGAAGTAVTSINAEGDIAGFYDDGGQDQGFVRSASGAITTFSPGYLGTLPFSINAAGATAGGLIDAADVLHGFVRAASGAMTTFDAPGAGTGAGQGTVAESINDAGVITGYYLDARFVYHSFVRAANGATATFDAPTAGTGSYQGTLSYGINDAGTITGYYLDASSAQHGFVRTSGGTITSFDVSGAIGTFPASVNAEGDIVGYSVTPKGVALPGFVRGARHGAIATFRVPGAGTDKGGGTFPHSINRAGTVAGYYLDAGGVYHGFLLIP